PRRPAPVREHPAWPRRRRQPVDQPAPRPPRRRARAAGAGRERHQRDPDAQPVPGVGSLHGARASRGCCMNAKVGADGMGEVVEVALERELAGVVANEAALIDAARWEEWLDLWSDGARHRLVREGGGWKIREKRVDLLNASRPLPAIQLFV